MNTHHSIGRFSPWWSALSAVVLMTAVALSSGCTGGAKGNASNGTNGTNGDGKADADAKPVKILTDSVPPPDLSNNGQFDADRVALQPGPAMAFESVSHDFGKISETDSVTCSFHFTNTGSGVLSIAEVKPTCTCTAVSIAKRDYKPGESGTIDVRFTPTSTGKQTKIINVASNDLVTPTLPVSVSADVEAFITIDPPNTNFGTILPGSTASKYVSIFSPDATMYVRETHTDNKFIHVKIVQAASPGSTAPAVGMPGQAMIEISIDSGAPWGPLFGWVSVTVEGTPPGKTQRMVHTRQFRVNASIFGDLVADPDTFRAGPLPNEEFERNIRLKRVSGQPFDLIQATINDINSPATLARATIQIKRVTDSEYDLVLKGAGGPQIGNFTATVRIKTDVPGEENIEIKIAGRVRGPAG